jgi:hypothetical protein
VASDDTNAQKSSLRSEIIGDTQRRDFEKEKSKTSCAEGNEAGGTSVDADSTKRPAGRATDGQYFKSGEPEVGNAKRRQKRA